jgi:hypothetical protein
MVPDAYCGPQPSNTVTIGSGLVLGIAHFVLGGLVAVWIDNPVVMLLWSASIVLLLLFPLYMPLVRRAAERR